MAGRRALFPISVDNRKFTTAVATAALRPIVMEYEEIVFLIADRLQLYNRACRVATGEALASVISDFEAKSAYYDQRARWIRKIRGQFWEHGVRGKWRIVGLDDLTDTGFYRIYRNLLIALHTVRKFREDVEKTAFNHWRRKTSIEARDVEQRLSEAYIIEEIAVNLRLRVHEGIESEYYVGEYLEPLTRLYGGAYGIDVFTLAGVERREVVFRFFEAIYSRTGMEWRLVERR